MRDNDLWPVGLLTRGAHLAVTAGREIGMGHLCGGLGRMVLQFWAGAEESAHKDFPKWISLSNWFFQEGEEINWKNYLATSEKYETLHGARFEYFPQLLNWAL
jgi:hypothetical protein